MDTVQENKTGTKPVELSQFEAKQRKLTELCEQCKLSFTFGHEYPPRFTIKPADEVAEQLAILDRAEVEEATSPDASMVWIYHPTGVQQIAHGRRFVVGVNVRKKLERVMQEMVDWWILYTYRMYTTDPDIRRAVRDTQVKRDLAREQKKREAAEKDG